MAKNYVCLLVVLMAIIAAFQAAQPGLIQAEANDRGGNDDGLILRSMEITTAIDNSYAITELTLNYENTENASHEASFSLSLPEKAFISNFTLTLGNRTFFADVLKKDEAQQKYDQAVASGNTAGLGQQIGTKRFAFSVNVAGDQNVTATLRYEEFVPKYLGERTYTIHFASMDMRPETFGLTVDMHSMTGITGLDADSDEYSLIEVWDTSNAVTLSHTEDSPRFESDLHITFSDYDHQKNGTVQGYYDIASEEYYFLNIFSPMRSDVGDGFSKDIIFVLDKSGSMEGEKMDQLKQSFDHILDQLPGGDRFNIIMFDSDYKTYRSGLISASEENKDKAKNYLGGQSAGGSTNLYDGLSEALDMLSYEESRVPIIVMLTDGLANAGTYTTPGSIRTHIREENTIMCPIFCLGFGYNVDMNFLNALSLENYAQGQQIHPGQDASEQIVNFYRTISTTLLRDITPSYGSRAYSVFPDSIPALYEGSETVIVGKYRIAENGESITSTITARAPQGTREFREDHPISYNDTEHESIKRFWAYARIHYLMDRLPMLSDSELEQAESEIESISIDAHFVTPYTSLFLEIEDADPESGETTQQPHDESNSANSYGPPPSYGYSQGGGSRMSGGADSGSLASSGIAEGGGIMLFLFIIPVIVCIAVLGIVMGVRRRRRKKQL